MFCGHIYLKNATNSHVLWLHQVEKRYTLPALFCTWHATVCLWSHSFHANSFLFAIILVWENTFSFWSRRMSDPLFAAKKKKFYIFWERLQWIWNTHLVCSGRWLTKGHSRPSKIKPGLFVRALQPSFYIFWICLGGTLPNTSTQAR